MRPNERSGVEEPIEISLAAPGRSLRDSPFRAGVVLRLDGEEVPNDGGRVVERRPDEPLDPEPPRRDPVGRPMVQSIDRRLS